MFKFFRIRSRYFIYFTWFLLFALFADTVNLDDYLPNSCDLHLDDIDMADQSLVNELISEVTGYTNTTAHGAKSLDNRSQSNKQNDIVVLYDLDSLALAASYSFEKETVIQSVNSKIEEALEFTSGKATSSQFLYLQFQSLLI